MDYRPKMRAYAFLSWTVVWCTGAAIWSSAPLDAKTSKVPATTTATSASKTTNGMLFTLMMSGYGQIKWYVSKEEGSKLVSPMVCYTMTPPKYVAILYNKSTKRYYRIADPKLWKRIRNVARGTDNEQLKYSPWQKVADEKLQGQDTTHYKRHLTNPRHRGQLTETLMEDMWALKKSPQIPQQYCDPLIYLFDFSSPDKTIPIKHLSVWKAYKAGKEFKSDSTLFVSMEKMERVHVSKHDFDVPADCQPVDNYTELMVTDAEPMPSMPTGR